MCACIYLGDVWVYECANLYVSVACKCHRACVEPRRQLSGVSLHLSTLTEVVSPLTAAEARLAGPQPPWDSCLGLHHRRAAVSSFRMGSGECTFRLLSCTVSMSTHEAGSPAQGHLYAVHVYSNVCSKQLTVFETSVKDIALKLCF